MSKHIITLEVELDEGGQWDVPHALGELTRRCQEVLIEDFAPDNPTSDEAFMRYDGYSGPYLLDVKGSASDV